MPTVRPGIKPLAVFPAPSGISGGLPLRVFPAEEWERFGGEPGQFRVLIGETWASRRFEVRSFYELDGLKEVVWRWFAAAAGLPAETPQPGAVLPDVVPGSLVRLDEPDGATLATRTRTIPFRDAAGDWRVWVFGRRTPVPLDNLTYRERDHARS